MTSLSRRNRPTTARATSSLAPMASSHPGQKGDRTRDFRGPVPFLTGVASLLLAGAAAIAQTPQLPPVRLTTPSDRPSVILRFGKDAEPTPSDPQPPQVLPVDKGPEP